MFKYHLAFLLLPLSFIACQQIQEKADGLTIAGIQVIGDAPTAAAANIVFQSTDGGQSWQDISAGLPPELETEGFLADNGELYLGAKTGIYIRKTATKAPVWEKEQLLEERSSAFFPGRAGIFAYSKNGHFYQKINSTGIWLPMFTNFQNTFIRSIFESVNGTVFIGCDNGLFKSADQGKTWKHVFEDGWVIKIVESGGVLLCTSQLGILRSTDDGENWNVVLSEGGVGIAVEVIEGGYAAITFNTESETRRVRISVDGGKTWQAIDAGLPPSMLIASIKQVGKDFFCGHPEGIFRSSDRGKSWHLIRPSIGNKVFNLSVSGSVIYAVPREGGC